MFRFIRNNSTWLGAGIVLTVLSSFGQTFFISVFAPVIQRDLGLSHAAWGLSYAAGTTLSALIMVWAGGLTDRLRVRVLGPMVMGGLALACLAMAVNQSVLLVPVVILGLRFFGQGMMSHVAMVAMARWFSRSRGRAISIAGLGYSVGEAMLPIAFVAAMGLVHWRLLWVVAAVVVLLMIPVLSRLLRTERSPQQLAETSETMGLDRRQWTRSEVIRTRLFWCMVPSVLGPSAFVTAYFFHHAHFADTKGWSQLSLVATFPIYTATSVMAMLIAGWAIDRFGSGRLVPVFQLPMALGFVAFSYSDAIPGALLGMILMGLSSGMNATLPGAFWAEYFGTRHLGSIKALATAIMVLGSALGPGITGVLIDAGVGISTQYLGVSIYFITASIIGAIGVAGLRPRLSPLIRE
ncbi:MFS transporter [Shimia ponticola]|uniref:MFS transporter n=1 Tax=Shimia ponticola TaxID=2582893 RepID=UPI0011BE51E6|nr:MFS transporter [Shimia ponticola]